MSASPVFSSAALGRPFIFPARSSAALLAQLDALPKLASAVTLASRLHVRPAPDMLSSGICQLDALTGGLRRQTDIVRGVLEKTRGDLTVAISTGGKAPAVAVRLRQHLEREIGEEYAQFLEIAGTLRAPLAQKYPDFETRKKLWYEVVDSDVLALLRAGNETGARERITEIFGL